MSYKLIILPFVQFDEWMTFFQKKLHSLQIDVLISVENYSTMKKPLYEAAPLLGMQLDNKKKQTFSWVAADNFEFVGKHDRQKMSMSSSEYLSFSKIYIFLPLDLQLASFAMHDKEFLLAILFMFYSSTLYHAILGFIQGTSSSGGGGQAKLLEFLAQKLAALLLLMPQWFPPHESFMSPQTTERWI